MNKRLVIIAIAFAVLIAAGYLLPPREAERESQPREFIVSVEAGLDAAELQSLLADLTIKARTLRSLQGNLLLLEVTSNEGDAEIVAKLERVPGIEMAEPNSEIKAQ